MKFLSRNASTTTSLGHERISSAICSSIRPRMASVTSSAVRLGSSLVSPKDVSIGNIRKSLSNCSIHSRLTSLIWSRTSGFIIDPVFPSTRSKPCSRFIASCGDASITKTAEIRFLQSSAMRNSWTLFLWFGRMRETRSIMAIQQMESKIPRSRKRICGSSGRGGFCVFSRIWASVVHAVQTLKFEYFLSRIGQTEARSTTTSVRKPQRFRNVCTCASVVVLPAFGTPANSITRGLRAFSANSFAEYSARP